MCTGSKVQTGPVAEHPCVDGGVVRRVLKGATSFLYLLELLRQELGLYSGRALAALCRACHGPPLLHRLREKASSQSDATMI